MFLIYIVIVKSTIILISNAHFTFSLVLAESASGSVLVQTYFTWTKLALMNNTMNHFFKGITWAMASNSPVFFS